MICQWKELMRLLPPWIRQEVDKQGREDAQEIRLRLHTNPEIVKTNGSFWVDGIVTSEDISFCLNTVTRYSPWTSESITDGYVTAVGGHRIGLCGQCVYTAEKLKNINGITSLCIRVARDFDGISGLLYQNRSSILIIGSPGCGKTTLLRDLIRRISDLGKRAVAVIDERRELFPYQDGKYAFQRGIRTDVLSGCKKGAGLDMLLRTMGPSVIALDEITNQDDCRALSEAAWCGVQLIATAHAAGREDLFARKIYSPIVESKIFQTLITIHPDKSWKEEVLPI